MDKTKFSKNELLEIESLEVRGGNADSTMSQEVCSNEAFGCGAGVDQSHCTNKVTGCGSPITQKCS
jgi:hypothetical protein